MIISLILSTEVTITDVSRFVRKSKWITNHQSVFRIRLYMELLTDSIWRAV